jgi:hypothetical protein
MHPAPFAFIAFSRINLNGQAIDIMTFKSPGRFFPFDQMGL